MQALPHSWGGAGEVRSLEVTSSPWRSEPWGSRPPAPVSHFYHGSCVSKLLETDPQVPEPVYPGGWLIGQDSVDWGLQGPEADMTIMPWASMFTSLSSVHP